MMIYLQKRVIDQNGRSPSSTENSKIRCGMTEIRERLEWAADYLAKNACRTKQRKSIQNRTLEGVLKGLNA